MTDTLSRPERIAYHADRVREAVVQSRDPLVRSWPDEAGAVLDRLAYAHAVDAAHAARSGGVR